MPFEFSEEDQQLTVHHFDPITGELTSSESGAVIKANTGLPAHSTDDAPPSTSAGKVAVYANNAWKIEEDRRGDVVYDKSTLEPITIDYIGEIKAEHTPAAPSDTEKWDEALKGWITDNDKLNNALDKALTGKLIEIDTKARQLIESGFDSSALGVVHKYDCRQGLDPVDLALSIEIAINSGSSVDYMAQLPGQHFADHSHTLKQLRQVAADLRGHVQSHRVIARAKKSAATNARNLNDLAAIEAVDISDWS